MFRDECNERPKVRRSKCTKLQKLLNRKSQIANRKSQFAGLLSVRSGSLKGGIGGVGEDEKSYSREGSGSLDGVLDLAMRQS